MPPGVRRSVLVGVALISFGVVVLEVSLTRIFAVTLWYYFGFLAISLALMGLAASAIACFIDPRRHLTGAGEREMPRYALRFAVYAPLAVLAHLRLSVQMYPSQDARLYAVFAVQMLLLLLAFYSAGMCLSLALCRHAQHANQVYGADLIGAGAGSLLIIPLLYRVSPMAAVFLVSAAASAAGWLFTSRTNAPLWRAVFGVVAAVSLLLCGINDRAGLLKITAVKNYQTSSFQLREDPALFERWSPVSRVTVHPQRPDGLPPYLEVRNDAGARTFLRQFNGDYSALATLQQYWAYVVHRLRPHGDVLIIGSGGGREVLAALASHQKSVTAVEINPVIVDLVTHRYAAYIGRIFQDPRVTLHLQEGRNFVARSPSRYDIVQLNMVDSWAGSAAGAYIFNENSLYTKEAIRDYVAHLRPDGWLLIIRHYLWDEALRLGVLIVESLEEAGVRDAHEQMAVLVSRQRWPPKAAILFKNGTVTRQDAEVIAQAAKQEGCSLIQAPHVGIEQLEQSQYAAYFRSLLRPSAYGRSRSELLRSNPRDLSPPTDDKPFFFFNKRPRDYFRLDPAEHAARRLAMPILYGVFVFLGVSGILTVIVPLCLSRALDLRQVPHRAAMLLYFAALGAGYMLIELPLIQRLTIFLGHPTYAFVVVLATLLFSSGLGSLASGGKPIAGNPRALSGVLAAIILLGLLDMAVLSGQLSRLMWMSKPFRILLAVSITAPLGFFMGMCFPLGVGIADRLHHRLIPWGWGVNGIFSVFASACSLVMSLSWGLRAAFACGVACYAFAFVLALYVQGAIEKQRQLRHDPLRPGAIMARRPLA